MVERGSEKKKNRASGGGGGGGGFEKERDRSLLLKPQISPYHAKKQQRRVLGGVEAIF